jgi:tetratricopeptide (TPR) repeat protein
MIGTAIIVILASLSCGCTLQTENSVPYVGQPPAVVTGPFVNGGGTAIAIAFKTDELSTFSPAAKEQFLEGLTLLSGSGRYNESLQYFDNALALDRNFSEAWVAKGVAFHDMKEYDDAIASYDRALALTPRDAGTWHLKAMAFSDRGNSSGAADCNRMAADLDPRYGNR